MGITGVVSLFAASILALFYSWFCPDKQCGWQLLLSAQILLAAGAGAVIRSACCSWMALVGVLELAAGLAAIGTWWATCNKTACDVAREITMPIMGIILPIAGLIASVPGVSACVSLAAVGWIGAIFGPIAAYAATCLLNQNP